MAVACNGTATAGLTTIGTTRKFYLVDAASNGSAQGTLQLDGVAPSTANMGTGFVYGTVHASNEYSSLIYGSVSPATNFTTTVLPPAAPTTANGFASTTKLTGTFLAGTWTIAIATIQTVAGTSGTANLRVRIYRSADPTFQTGVTEVTAATQALATWTISATTQQNKTVSWTAPEFSLQDEYLLMAVAVEVHSGAVSATGATVVLVQDATHSVVTTTQFSNAPPTSVGTSTFFARLDSSTLAQFSVLYEMQAETGTLGQFLQFLTANDGTVTYTPSADTALITGPTMIVGQWYFFALVTFGTRNAILYWKPVGTSTCLTGSESGSGDDFTGHPPASLDLGQFAPTPGALALLSFAGLKRWNAILVQAEIELESQQLAPVRTSDLWGAWPLSSPSDLSCNNDRSRDMTSLGAGNSLVSPPPVPLYVTRTWKGIIAPVARAMTVSVTGSASVTDAIAVARAFKDAIAGSASVTDAIAVARAFKDAIAGSANVSDTLAVARGMAATIAGHANVADALVVLRALGLSANGAATLLLSIGELVTMGVSLHGSASATLPLAVQRALADGIAGVASMSETLGVARSLASAMTGAAAFEAALSEVIPPPAASGPVTGGKSQRSRQRRQALDEERWNRWLADLAAKLRESGAIQSAPEGPHVAGHTVVEVPVPIRVNVPIVTLVDRLVPAKTNWMLAAFLVGIGTGLGLATSPKRRPTKPKRRSPRGK